MLKYVGKRLVWLIPVLLGVTLFMFFLLDITPGNPAEIILGDNATPENVAALTAEMGLDDPFFVRYFRYVSEIIRFDFGESYMTGRSVSDEISFRMPYTYRIAFISIGIAIIIGIPLGVFAAVNQYTWKDNLAIFLSLFFVSMPSFWFALLLIRFFAVQLGVLPTSGVTSWLGYVLPCVSVSIGNIANIARQTRSSMLEQIRQDYVVTARAKGQTEGKVIYSHALRNALIPIITIVGGQLAGAMGGAMIAETIFSIPGLANYMLTGLTQRDYPVILGTVLVISITFSIVMLFVDLIYCAVDPRIRSQFSKPKKTASAQSKEE